MSVVVNVMLSLMSVMKLCTLGSFCFRGELGFLNCDDICMCVVNKQFQLLEFMQYDQIYLTFTAGYVCLCGVCVRTWSGCEVVLVPCVVGSVVALTVMRVLLFVCELSMLRVLG